MNRKELVDELSQRFEGNREVAAQALDSVVDVITKSVSAGEKVVINGFGEFERKARDAGAKAGEYVPEFKPGKELRDVVSGAREWRDRVTDSLAVVPAAAVEQASRAAAGTMRSVAEKARELAAELSSAGDADAGRATNAGAGQTAKKASAKKATKKAPAEKSAAAKKTTAKKTAAQSAKKAQAKKAPAKKTPAGKKSTSKQAAAKKAPAKKTAAAKAPAAKKTAKAPAKKSATTQSTAGAKQPGT